ncbi:vacuolar protein sorting-associated protein 37B [Ambystoma mexicanum]|uniref:vacuolar protein sorting-associated protein 37B n=1 Tax=Ambystoma mexicanum TaxID=8296 RepID=UPI0037E8FEC9
MAVDVSKFAGLTLTQLNELLEDEDKLRGISQEMDEVQNVQLTKDMTLAGNRSLAEENLLYQPQIDSLKANLTQKYQELQVLFEAHQIKKTKLDQQSSNASLETLLALLQTEGAKIEEETENMAENFLDGEIPLDSFIDEYQSKRKLAHLRRVKIEKLQEMVLKGQRLPQAHVLAQPRQSIVTPAPQTCYPSELNNPPSVMPRRAVPPPPPAVAQPGAFPTPFTAAMGSGSANLPYTPCPYPPLPPRVNPAMQPGYQHAFLSQYPPALPNRPPPRLPPNAGFILQ